MQSHAKGTPVHVSHLQTKVSKLANIELNHTDKKCLCLRLISTRVTLLLCHIVLMRFIWSV